MNICFLGCIDYCVVIKGIYFYETYVGLSIGLSIKKERMSLGKEEETEKKSVLGVLTDKILQYSP